ncbi:MAG: putative lactoylglutathione lyase [Halopseudomonas sp.]|jgi:predicted lactoylglutathione lyase|uniref:VOC family protein n=1 Tax=Halopseudomonas sp. TaxID=2901191 RepID=UPI0039E415DB
MIGYVTIGTRDIEKAKAFYVDLLSGMGAKVLMDIGRLAMIGPGLDKPMLAVCTPYDNESPAPGNGNMFAIPAGSKEAVDQLYHKAIALGATDAGEPGARMPTFYGAYLRDLDGNKLAFFHMG